MNKIDIKNLSREDLAKGLEEMGYERYRAGQIFKRLYKFGAGSFDPSAGSGSNPESTEGFDDMTDIPLDLRVYLKNKFHITHLTLMDSRSSALDRTTKYLFKLEDANTIETVYLPEERRTTICLSSQVGCKFSCSFCASAPFGFVRNLMASEIMDVVISVREKNPYSIITNLVFMGIGEPLDNYDNVLRAIRIFNDKDAFNIGARKITVSTCGILPGIKRLSREGLQVELSVSLHSADDGIRSGIVPINKRYPVKELIASCREYIEKTNRIITFEYVLIKGVNSSEGDARRLAALLKGIKCKVNTISYNKIRAKGYDEPSQADVRAFMRILKDSGVNATHRKSKGEDIDAGCGQLRISKIDG